MYASTWRRGEKRSQNQKNEFQLTMTLTTDLMCVLNIPIYLHLNNRVARYTVCFKEFSHSLSFLILIFSLKHRKEIILLPMKKHGTQRFLVKHLNVKASKNSSRKPDLVPLLHHPVYFSLECEL